MTLTLPAYRSTRSRWWRFTEALYTAYVNLHIRSAERTERSFYVQIDLLSDRNA